jgi:MFS family permease
MEWQWSYFGLASEILNRSKTPANVVQYYLTLILDSIGYKSEATQTLINAVLAIWSLISTGFVAFFMVDRFPRRTLFLVSTAGMLTSYVGKKDLTLLSILLELIAELVWTALEATYEKQVAATGTGNPALAKGVLAMIVFYNTSFNIGWTPLQVTYVVEILPFNLRARVRTMQSSSRVHQSDYHRDLSFTASVWL